MEGKIKYRCSNCGNTVLIDPDEVKKGIPECCGEGMEEVFPKPPCDTASGDPEHARPTEREEPCEEQDT
ncbi:MAG: hypothetical protein GF408_01945 [Candidatus Omnitrophica bacterium]|nr:hypothetical protein [Candidatus Omnitrophota bacterium]